MSDHVRNGKMSFVPGIWTDSSSCDTLVASPAYCKIVMNSRYGRRRPVAHHLSIRATMLMLSSFSSVYSDLAQKSIVLETLGPILPRSAIFPIGRQRIMGSRPHIPSPPFLRVGNFQSTDVILPHGQLQENLQNTVGTWIVFCGVPALIRSTRVCKLGLVGVFSKHSWRSTTKRYTSGTGRNLYDTV